MESLETREVSFEVTRSESDGDGLTLEGYAAVFDSPAEIDSHEGHFIERIKPGAFKKTLRERTPVLMFNHGTHPLIGKMPIGVIQRAREDSKGVFVRARMAANWLMEPVREAIEQGAISGWSFAFMVPRGKDVWREPRQRGGVRERDVFELSCRELGPVVYPAYKETSLGLRSQELVDVLEDPEARSELARAVFAMRADVPILGEVLDTSEEAVREDTPNEAVTHDEPPKEHSSIPNALRVKARVESSNLKEKADA